MHSNVCPRIGFNKSVSNIWDQAINKNNYHPYHDVTKQSTDNILQYIANAMACIIQVNI